VNFKKIFTCLFCILISFGSFVFAVDEINQVWVEETALTATETEKLEIFSKAAVVYNSDTDTILWGKNENLKLPMASTTKIMTAIILLENADLSQTVEVCKEAAMVGGSSLGIKTGDKITLNDLLYGLMICSGNDAAMQIAITVGGSVESFAEMMNKKAAELELENTHFVTPHGLDIDEHYTTAKELAILADYALGIPKIAEVVSQKNYTVTINGYPKTLSNTNELLGYLNGVNGVKTGYTGNAGRCLVTSATRNNMSVISVVLGADTKKIRSSDSIKLIEYAYKNFTIINLEEKILNEFENWKSINSKRIFINKGIENFLELELEKHEDHIVCLENTKIDNIDFDISYEKYFEAPIYKNQQIGNFKIYLDGNEYSILRILNSKDIYRKDFEYYIQRLFKHIQNPC